MVALVVGVDIMVGAHGILLPSGLVVWEWYTPTVPLDGCGLHSIVKYVRTFEPLLLPLPLYDKSARSPYVERMRPLS